MYLNHAPSTWTVTVGGVRYDLPEDGWAAYQPASGFVAFSAIPPSVGGNRIDYCFAPGEYEFFDGRGVVNGWGNIDTGGVRRLEVENFVHGRTVSETPSGAILVTQGAAPVCTHVAIVGPAAIKSGQRYALEAIAHYANGAFRNVTTLVDWSSSNGNVAQVNDGAVLKALAPGQATIATTNFGTVASTPLIVQVH
jgi:hypothetical protein